MYLLRASGSPPDSSSHKYRNKASLGRRLSFELGRGYPLYQEAHRDRNAGHIIATVKM